MTLEISNLSSDSLIDCLDTSIQCSIYCDLLAASAWAFKLEEVEPLEKKRANNGWMKEWKTIWAPLYSYVSGFEQQTGLSDYMIITYPN
jgi:hypothetical protein